MLPHLTRLLRRLPFPTFSRMQYVYSLPYRSFAPPSSDDPTDPSDHPSILTNFDRSSFSEDERSPPRFFSSSPSDNSKILTEEDLAYHLHKTEGLPIHTLFSSDSPEYLRGFTLTSHPWKAPLRRYWPLGLLSFIPFAWIPASAGFLIWLLLRAKLVPYNLLRRVRESAFGESLPRYVSFVRTAGGGGSGADSDSNSDLFYLGTSFVSNLRWREVSRRKEVVDAEVVVQTTISRGKIPFVKLTIRQTEGGDFLGEFSDRRLILLSSERWNQGREWVKGLRSEEEEEQTDSNEGGEQLSEEVDDDDLVRLLVETSSSTSATVSDGNGKGEDDYQDYDDDVGEDDEDSYWNRDEYSVVRTYYVGCEDVHEAHLLVQFFLQGV